MQFLKRVLVVVLILGISSNLLALPDLVVSSQGNTVINAVPSQVCYLPVRVENIGDQDAIPQEVGLLNTSIYFSDINFANWDSYEFHIQRASEFNLDLLEAQNYYEDTIQFEAPPWIGTFYLRSKVDNYNLVNESNESNNWSKVVKLVVAYENCQDYTKYARAKLFEGKLSDYKAAKRYLDEAINLSDCSDMRETYFLHAIARTIYLIIAEDGPPYNSFFEIANLFGVEIENNQINNLYLSWPVNHHDYYKMPDDVPDANWFANMAANVSVPEVDSILAELDLIKDEPGDKFKLIFDGNDIENMSPVEVDYAEVMMLKGWLKLFRAMYLMNSAYDIYVGEDYKLFEKIAGDCLSINNLLITYPDLLKVLPSGNYSEDGKAILADSKQSYIDGVNYYLEVLDYIDNEEDYQEDDLIYLTEDSNEAVDEFTDQIIKIRDSLINDTSEIYCVETTKTYDVVDVNKNPFGKMQIVFNAFKIPEKAIFNHSESTFRSNTIEFDNSNFYGEFVRHSDYAWMTMYGTISDDHNSITSISYGYYDYELGSYVNYYDLDANFYENKFWKEEIDLNPIYGNSARYPEPVAIRDLLPEFDNLNGVLPGTVGKGLGYDGKLGGITPDKDQAFWNNTYNLQPAGGIYIPAMNSWQFAYYDQVMFWLDEQLIFEDRIDDVKESVDQSVNIEKFYMGTFDNELYGEIMLSDINGFDNRNHYNVYLSYSPDEDQCLDTIMFEIRYNGSLEIKCYKKVPQEHYSYWQEMSNVWCSCSLTSDGIGFEVNLSNLGTALPGRYVTVKSDYQVYPESIEDTNPTHVQILPVGSISGQVSCAGWSGGPIYVQACQDVNDLEKSVIKTIMLEEPGEYILEGLGLGWKGYIRAYTPVMGADMIEWQAFNVYSEPFQVALRTMNEEDVDVVIMFPTLLESGVEVFDTIAQGSGNTNFYALDVTERFGFNFEFTNYSGYLTMSILDRNGKTKILETETSTYFTGHSGYSFSKPGRYYVAINDKSWNKRGGNYRLFMTANNPTFEADISGWEGPSVSDLEVNMSDFVTLSNNWMMPCGEPYWCDKADFNRDGIVDFKDIIVLLDQWLFSY